MQFVAAPVGPTHELDGCICAGRDRKRTQLSLKIKGYSVRQRAENWLFIHGNVGKTGLVLRTKHVAVRVPSFIGYGRRGYGRAGGLR